MPRLSNPVKRLLLSLILAELLGISKKHKIAKTYILETLECYNSVLERLEVIDTTCIYSLGCELQAPNMWYSRYIFRVRYSCSNVARQGPLT